MAPNSVDFSELVEDSVGFDELWPGAFDSTDIGPEPLRYGILSNAVGGNEVAPNTLTGSDIDESTLSVPAMGCQTGKILGFARIDGDGGMGSGYGTTHVSGARNCAAGSVEARRIVEGHYAVRFNGNPATLALLTPNADAAANETDNIYAFLGRPTSGTDAGAFLISSTDNNGADEDGDFIIALP